MYDPIYDPEAVYQEADILQAQYEAESKAAAKKQAAGICLHGSSVGYLPVPFYEAQKDLKPGQQKCTEGCGQVFESWEEWIEAHQAACA